MFIDDDYSWESRESVLKNTQNRARMLWKCEFFEFRSGWHPQSPQSFVPRSEWKESRRRKNKLFQEEKSFFPRRKPIRDKSGILGDWNKCLQCLPNMTFYCKIYKSFEYKFSFLKIQLRRFQFGLIAEIIFSYRYLMSPCLHWYEQNDERVVRMGASTQLTSSAVDEIQWKLIGRHCSDIYMATGQSSKDMMGKTYFWVFSMLFLKRFQSFPLNLWVEKKMTTYGCRQPCRQIWTTEKFVEHQTTLQKTIMTVNYFLLFPPHFPLDIGVVQFQE